MSEIESGKKFSNLGQMDPAERTNLLYEAAIEGLVKELDACGVKATIGDDGFGVSYTANSEKFPIFKLINKCTDARVTANFEFAEEDRTKEDRACRVLAYCENLKERLNLLKAIADSASMWMKMGLVLDDVDFNYVVYGCGLDDETEPESNAMAKRFINKAKGDPDKAYLAAYTDLHAALAADKEHERLYVRNLADFEQISEVYAIRFTAMLIAQNRMRWKGGLVFVDLGKTDKGALVANVTTLNQNDEVTSTQAITLSSASESLNKIEEIYVGNCKACGIENRLANSGELASKAPLVSPQAAMSSIITKASMLLTGRRW